VALGTVQESKGHEKVPTTDFIPNSMDYFSPEDLSVLVVAVPLDPSLRQSLFSFRREYLFIFFG
jgi:hypothetical protein